MVKHSHNRSTQHHFGYTRNGAGFTLIEALAAIGIMLVAIVGPLTLASQSLRSATVAKEQITTAFLAQEAVELIRNVRDTNVLEGLSWTNGLSACMGGNNPPRYCYVDAVARTITECPTTGTGQNKQNACPVLTYDSTTGSYGHNPAWPDSIFSRVVRIEEQEPGQEIEVIVTTSWPVGHTTRSFVIRERLLAW